MSYTDKQIQLECQVVDYFTDIAGPDGICDFSFGEVIQFATVNGYTEEDGIAVAENLGRYDDGSYSRRKRRKV